MKIKFPILARYPKQLNTLFKYLDSKGLHWCDGSRLVDNKIVDAPIWIFLDSFGISYWKIDPTNEDEFDINYVSYCCCYRPREVEI